MNTPNTKTNNATKTGGATSTAASQYQNPDHLDEPGTINISVGSATLLLEVLNTCDEFLRGAPRTVRVELAEFCLSRPGISSGVLIDAVGLHALHLRARLTDQQTAAQQAGAARQARR